MWSWHTWIQIKYRVFLPHRDFSLRYIDSTALKELGTVFKRTFLKVNFVENPIWNYRKNFTKYLSLLCNFNWSKDIGLFVDKIQKQFREHTYIANEIKSWRWVRNSLSLLNEKFVKGFSTKVCEEHGFRVCTLILYLYYQQSKGVTPKGLSQALQHSSTVQKYCRKMSVQTILPSM